MASFFNKTIFQRLRIIFKIVASRFTKDPPSKGPWSYATTVKKRAQYIKDGAGCLLYKNQVF